MESEFSIPVKVEWNWSSSQWKWNGIGIDILIISKTNINLTIVLFNQLSSSVSLYFIYVLDQGFPNGGPQRVKKGPRDYFQKLL
jgi:hypothetical protein